MTSYDYPWRTENIIERIGSRRKHVVRVNESDSSPAVVKRTKIKGVKGLILRLVSQLVKGLLRPESKRLRPGYKKDETTSGEDRKQLGTTLVSRSYSSYECVTDGTGPDMVSENRVLETRDDSDLMLFVESFRCVFVRDLGLSSFKNMVPT